MTILLALFYLFFLFKNYKKAIAFFVVFYPWLAQFTFPITVVTFIGFCAVVTFIFFVAKEKISLKLMSKYPIKYASFLILLSFVVSNYFSKERHDAYMIILIACSLLIVFCFWYLVVREPEKIIQYVLKYALTLSVIVAFYSLFEAVSQTNPYIQFVNTLDLYSNNRFIDEIRYGVKRTQSIFSMHTTSGCVALLLFSIFSYLKFYCGYVCCKNWDKTIIALLFVAVFLCGARSAIIASVFVCFMFLSKRILKPKFMIPLFILSILGLYFLLDYFSAIYNSIVQSNDNGGSSADMRAAQYEIAYYYLQKNFLFGNGLAFTWNVALAKFKNLYGAESIWIPVMIDQGVFGCIAYVILLFENICYVIRNNRKRLVFFVLGLWCFNTLSSIPCVEVTYFFLYSLIIIESEKIVRNM